VHGFHSLRDLSGSGDRLRGCQAGVGRQEEPGVFEHGSEGSEAHARRRVRVEGHAADTLECLGGNCFGLVTIEQFLLGAGLLQRRLEPGCMEPVGDGIAMDARLAGGRGAVKPAEIAQNGRPAPL